LAPGPAADLAARVRMPHTRHAQIRTIVGESGLAQHLLS
jgi:hypothetical protein